MSKGGVFLALSLEECIMLNEKFEKLYDWKNLEPLFEKFIPELIKMQDTVNDSGDVVTPLPDDKKQELIDIKFNEEARNPEDVARQMLDEIYPYRMKQNHKKFFCFVPSAVNPYSVFGDVLNTFINPFGGGYSVSPGIVTVEQMTINFLGEQIGYEPKPLGGVFVSGGSTANLTAAIAARDFKLDLEEITKGTVYVSDQTHSSMAKGLRIAGIAPVNIKIIPTDDNFQIRLDLLEAELEKDVAAGKIPFMIVGTAGTTNTGAIDPLNQMADLAEKYETWFHVDGAYGASVLLSSHRDLLKGIERSDSVTWDAHKWLFQTYSCACIVVKDKMRLLNSFHTHPEYLKDVDSTEDGFNFWDMGIEMTRPIRGAKLWFTLQTLGLDNMRAILDRSIELAKFLQSEIEKHDEFEIIAPAKTGILNFRYNNPEMSAERLDEINQSISMRAMHNDKSAFLTTILKGKTVLRFCCNNALLTEEDVLDLVEEIRVYLAEELAK